MLGAIAGDMIGSVYEHNPVDEYRDEFPLFTPYSGFTDDTVMTIAVAEALKTGIGTDSLHDILIDSMHNFGEAYPLAGYGINFEEWLLCGYRTPYNSFGNGSAMRVSPVGWVATSLEEAEKLAAITAEVTHNHPEGIKGAQAVAGSIFLARQGKTKDEIRVYVAERHKYNLSRTLDDIREFYSFDVTCQGSVPEAIIAFLESGNFEEAVRNAIWLRGDADTQAAIAGSIAEAFYGGVPGEIAAQTLKRLDDRLLQGWYDWQNWLQRNNCRLN